MCFQYHIMVYSIIVTGLCISWRSCQSSLILIMIICDRLVYRWLKGHGNRTALQLKQPAHPAGRNRKAGAGRGATTRYPALEQNPGIIASTDTDGDIEYVSRSLPL